MISDHADAFVALLDADNTNPPLVVFKGKVPTGAQPPYACVYFADHDPEQPDSRPLDGTPQRFVMRAYIHSVGGNETASLAVAQRVRTALLNITPNIAGRICFPIRREDGQPVTGDESTGALVMSKADVYRLESEPSSS
jgi:hypothetical protein